MNRLVPIAAVAAVTLTGLAGASASSDAAGRTAPERTQHVTRLLVQDVEAHPLGKNHPAGADRLRSVETHKIVGYESFSGVVNPETERLRFWLADALKGGVITSYFNLPLEGVGNTFSGRIVDGTGKYRGIEGTIHVRNSENGRTVYTLRYTL